MTLYYSVAQRSPNVLVYENFASSASGHDTLAIEDYLRGGMPPAVMNFDYMSRGLPAMQGTFSELYET